MCLLTNDWLSIMVYKDKGLVRPVAHYKMITWHQRTFRHPAVSNYAIIKECVTTNCHCWTAFAVELPLLSLWGSDHICSLHSVNLTPFPALSSNSVISSGMPSMRGSTILYSQWSWTSYLHFAPLLPKSILFDSFFHTYTRKKATSPLRRKFHKGLIIYFYSLSHQWIRTLFICFEAQKAVGKGQFEYTSCRFKPLSIWPSFKIISV